MSDTPVPAANGPPPAPAPKKKRRFSFDNRFLAPILITCILLVGWWQFGITENLPAPWLSQLTSGWITTYSPTFVAILVAIGLELFLGKLVTGKWPHLASAYISGISVGILVRSTEIWPYIVCSLISIASKYAIRFRGRHLWNPSNLGVSVLLFLAPAYVGSLSQHWGNNLWPVVVIWCLGSLTLWRLGRLHISITYAAAFLLLSLVRSTITGHRWLTEVAPITGPMYQLFIFFMITDPKTTPKKKWSQCVVVLLVAIVETILRLYEEPHAPFFALFIVGPITNLIEILWDSRKASRPAAPAVAPAAVTVASANGSAGPAPAVVPEAPTVPGEAAVPAGAPGNRSS
jgi:enediyne biosynthesis protein E5